MPRGFNYFRVKCSDGRRFYWDNGECASRCYLRLCNEGLAWVELQERDDTQGRFVTRERFEADWVAMMKP